MRRRHFLANPVDTWSDDGLFFRTYPFSKRFRSSEMRDDKNRAEMGSPTRSDAKPCITREPNSSNLLMIARFGYSLMGIRGLGPSSVLFHE